MTHTVSRRDALKASTCGMGYLAFASLCQQAEAASSRSLTPKQPHHEPRAKRMIFLHMRGGPSHMETFEYKPELNKRHGQKAKCGKRLLVGTRWNWKRRGESGLWVSDLVKLGWLQWRLQSSSDDRIVLAGMPRTVGGVSYVVGEPDLDEQQLAEFVRR